MTTKSQLKIFISHLSEHKILAKGIADYMRRHNILPFVAHEDIQPTAIWQEEIEAFLQTADCMLALLHKGYSQSPWCNQEVGFCLARGIPLICVRIEEDPKGFLGRRQAYSPQHPMDASIEGRRIVELLRNHANRNAAIRAWVVSSFQCSGSYAMSNSLCDALRGISLTQEELAEIRTAFGSNSQVNGAMNISEILGTEWVRSQRFPS